ncbi:aspartate/glutamate racemase family protein [Kytococcus sedentarius]|uniref:aspartate/glutamate racemase family protein n=1 Tax=Kytococcus sedentarius TaxID=1276 RepID=UPI0035BC025A
MLRGSPGTSPWRPVGVIGGMGPAATVDFLARLVAATPATTDQEHIPVVVWGDPTVPDRVAAARGQDTSPVPWMRAGAQGLAHMGAEVLAVACNTAHAFAAEATAGLGVELVSMVDASAAALAADGSAAGARRVALFGTRGLVEAGLYQGALASHRIETVVPDDARQEAVSALILRVKAAEPLPGLVQELAGHVAAQADAGCTHALVACTELSLLVTEAQRAGVTFALPVVDASDELARAVVRAAAR